MQKNQVLRQRSITAVFFGVAVISLLLFSQWTVAALLFVIALGAAHEYLTITKNPVSRPAVLLVYTLIFFLIFFACRDKAVLLFLCAFNCVMFIAAVIHLKTPFIPHERTSTITGLLYTVPSSAVFTSYLFHHNHSDHLILFHIILLIWANDSFAYLTGSRIGKNKLWPAISPGKTWEGFIGGGIFTVITALVIYSLTREYSLFFWIIAAIIIWVIGTLGDLFESSIKRHFGVKDSGTILPGHGGILDRFDSFIFVLPFILFLLLNF